MTLPYTLASDALDVATTNQSNSPGADTTPPDWDTETLSLYFTVNIQIYKIVSPVLLAIGIPGNFLCAYLWLQRRLRTSSALYLSALGVAEFCFLLLFIIQYLERGYKARITTSYFTCKAFVPVFYFTQYLHPLLTAAYTIERWYAVTFPFRAYKVCTIKVACIVIVCLAVFSAWMSSAQLPFWQYSQEDDLCDLIPEVLTGYGFWHEFYTALMSVIEMFFFAAIPLVVLIVNTMVIFITRQLARSDMMKDVARLQERKPQGSQAAATTVTLLILSFYFIFTTLPVSACSILSLKFPEGNRSYNWTYEQIAADQVWRAHFRFDTLRTVVQDCIGLSQYCCAFYIYMATSQPFRSAALELLARCLPCLFGGIYQRLRRRQVLEMSGVTPSTSAVRKEAMTRSERDVQLAKAQDAASSCPAPRERIGWRAALRCAARPKTRRELDQVRYTHENNGLDLAKLLPHKLDSCA